MKRIRIHYLIRLGVFWLLFFALFRILFIIYHHAKIPDGQHSQTSLSFYYSLPLDICIISLLLIVPYLLWSLQQFYKSRLIHQINLGYQFIVISFVSALSIFNIKMYGEYENLLSTEELAYLLYPKEAITFLSLWSLLLLFAASGVFAIVGIRAYRKYLTNFSYPVENKKYKLFLVILIPFILFAGYRGLGKAPLDRTVADYSDIKINNDLATNSIWYLGHSFCANTDIPEE